MSLAQQTINSNTISYQGMIVDSSGKPLPDGSIPISVSLWSAPTGGSRIWSDSFNPILKLGVFNIALGSGTPLPPSTAMDMQLWIGVSVSGAPEALSRTQLSAVPMAINVADSSITTAKIADGAITWNKMGTEYVPYLRVNGAKVNTGQNSINFTGSEGMIVDYDSNSMSLIVHPDTTLSSGTIGGMHTLNTGDPWLEGGNGEAIINPILGTTNTSFGLTVVSANVNRIDMPSSSGINLDPGSSGVSVNTFTSAGVVHNGATGLLSSSLVDLTTDVTGILPLANGGNGSATPWFTSGNPIGSSDFIGSDGTNINPLVFKIGSGTPVIVYRMAFGSGADVDIVGGFSGNTIAYQGNTIAGGGSSGLPNTTTADYGSIGGGTANTVAEYGSISGGKDNNAGSLGHVGGGYGNWATGNSSVVAGGGGTDWTVGATNPNLALATLSAIGGGDSNQIATTGDHAVIAGGSFNQIMYSTDNSYSAILGGYDNHAYSDHVVIGGGGQNFADGSYSTIGGGNQNHLSLGEFNAVAGGFHNWILSPVPSIIFPLGSCNNVIAGGVYNSIDLSVTGVAGAAICGGEYNDVRASLASIGGGWENHIESSAEAATIPGGEALDANLSFQTVIGELNVAPASTLTTPNDDLEFIMGNGTNPDPSGIPGIGNGIEASYDGHLTVHDVNGTTRPMIIGSMYVDNVAYAWGAVSGNTLTDQFGITSMVHSAAGTYTFTLNLKNAPDVSSLDPIAFDGVVIASLNNACGISISTPAVSGNTETGPITFTINTNQMSVCVPPVGGGCPLSVTCAEASGTDANFQFVVYGRAVPQHP
jgi:hypothetical protein